LETAFTADWRPFTEAPAEMLWAEMLRAVESSFEVTLAPPAPTEFAEIRLDRVLRADWMPLTDVPAVESRTEYIVLATEAIMAET
jgi:hypothetical protein